jgi:predicted dienelactone hydrolase
MRPENGARLFSAAGLMRRFSVSALIVGMTALMFGVIGGAASAEECMSPVVGYRTMLIGERIVAIWYPAEAHPAQYAYGPKFSSLLALDAPPSRVCGKPVPLVVFSHGDLGCAIQSVAFTEELARHGYVVAAPDHADAALCHTGKPARRTPAPAQPPILSPDEWDEASRIDRDRDLEAVIEELLSNGEFKPVIDAQSIGAAGHSLGGYTVGGMAGGWPSWRDTRIRAVLAFSPYVMPFQARNTLGGVHVPLMYQGGTLDVGITPFLQGPKGAYAAANAPAYFVVLKNAGHFAWVNCGRERTTAECLTNVPNIQLINDYGIAFFDRYLKNRPQSLLEDRHNSKVAAYDFKLP